METAPTTEASAAPAEQPQLNSRYKLIAVRVAQGCTNVAIANELRLTPARVAQIIKHPAVRALITQYEDTIAEQCINQAVQAQTEVYRHGMNSFSHAARTIDGTIIVEESEREKNNRWLGDKVIQVSGAQLAEGRESAKTHIDRQVIINVTAPQLKSIRDVMAEPLQLTDDALDVDDAGDVGNG